MALRRPTVSAVYTLFRTRETAVPKFSSLTTHGMFRSGPSSQAATTRAPNTRLLSSSLDNHERTNQKLRTHAVSIFQGDYTDDYDDDNEEYSAMEESAFPDEDDEDYEDYEDREEAPDADDDKWDNAVDDEGVVDNYDEDNGDLAETVDDRSDEKRWDIFASDDEEDDDEDDDEFTDPIEREKEEKRQQELLKLQMQEDAQKARWIQSGLPPVRVQELDERGRAYGRGSRKEASARVWIQPGEGVVTVNRREFLDYFPRDSDRNTILSPFIATKTCGKFDAIIAVEGGGLTGKAGAIRHGLSRALQRYDPDHRPPLKRLGFLTRDSRMVERKKIGLKKARKAPQWVRR